MLTAAIASGDLTSSAQLLASLEQSGLIRSVVQWTVPADRMPESANVPDVVFLDMARNPDPFFTFAAQIRRAYPAIKVIACSASVPPDPGLLLEAMRSGVQDFLAKPVQSESLKRILTDVSTSLHEIEPQSQDKVIVLMGAKGGVGTTTVAVNLGVQLATFGQKRTVLLDFARPLGNAHLLLDLQPRFTVRDAVDSLNRLDSHFLAGLLTKHKTKLELLGGVTQPEEWQAIDVGALDRAVNVAQNSFDIVLLDMGSQFSAEWSSILRLARMILLVAEANVPSLWTLERRLVALKGLGVDPSRARIIINRWHKGDDQIVRGVQKESGYPIFANLPNDYRKTSQAVNLGTPIPDNHNNVLISRYRQIAEQVLGLEARPAEKKGALSGLFSFSGRK